MSRPRGTGPERIEVPATLVWIDGDEAILVRWEGAARIERIGSEAAGLGFVEAVAGRVPVGDDVRIVGPGDVRLSLGRRIREEDRRAGRKRHVDTRAAGPLTERELVAHVRELAGDRPPEPVAR
jgi:hypothetical protein